MPRRVTHLFSISVVALWVSSCAGHSTNATAADPASGSEQSASKVTPTELGGRLFDNWYAELAVDFVPDDPSTQALDGKGGPFSNGTLPDRKGAPMPNAGHDYRLKNLFGWDLRGSDGVYGPNFLATSEVLVPDLLKNTESRETWIQRLTQGEDAIPAYGEVWSPAQIEAVVTFLLSVREGTSPQPGDIFTLTSKEQGLYTLVEGAALARGHDIFARTCARCHGTDGAKSALVDGKYSLGTRARTHAYETWLKVLSGQPGTNMHSQLESSLTREQKGSALLDLHAALCDRTRYPQGPGSEPDVSDNDARCGAYLR